MVCIQFATSLTYQQVICPSEVAPLHSGDP